MNFNPEIHEQIIVDGVVKGYRLKSVAVAPEPMRIISVGSFRRRLTTTEKVAIKISADPVLAVFEEDLLASTYVDLDFPATVDGIDYLEAQGIIAPGRKAEILADGEPLEAPDKTA